MTLGEHVENASRVVVDGTVGGAGVTSPWWLGLIESGVHWYFLLGGVALLTLRLVVAARQVRKP